MVVRGVLRSGLGVRTAVRVAVPADTVSNAVMEVVDNGVVLAVPGAMEAGASSWVFRASLTVALGVAFVVTLPLNRWMMSRGRGHAVVHGLHAHGDRSRTARDPGLRREAGVAPRHRTGHLPPEGGAGGCVSG